ASKPAREPADAERRKHQVQHTRLGNEFGIRSCREDAVAIEVYDSVIELELERAVEGRVGITDKNDRADDVRDHAGQSVERRHCRDGSDVDARHGGQARKEGGKVECPGGEARLIRERYRCIEPIDDAGAAVVEVDARREETAAAYIKRRVPEKIQGIERAVV